MKSHVYTAVKLSEDLEAAPVIVDVIVANSTEIVEREEDDVQVDPASAAPAEQAQACSWNDQVKCAGCVGAISGCLTGGFFLSLVCASGCIYAASQEKGTSTAGEIARSCGQFGIEANKMMRDIDEKHHVIDNSKTAAVAAWKKAKEVNNEYHVLERTKDCVKSGVQAGVEFSREHKLVERTAQSVRTVVSAVAQEMANAGTAPSTGTSQEVAEDTGVEAEESVVEDEEWEATIKSAKK